MASRSLGVTTDDQREFDVHGTRRRAENWSNCGKPADPTVAMCEASAAAAYAASLMEPARPGRTVVEKTTRLRRALMNTHR